jgi:hypothetical protein
MSGTKRATPDHEITMMQRFCRDLAHLQPGARRRVLAYVCARVDTLPVIAAVGGVVDDGEHHADMFTGDLPHLKGAAE